MKGVIYHSILIVVVFVGIFLGTLPDLFPSALSWCPYFRKLDQGITALTVFDRSDTPNAVLDREASSYPAIYALLRSIKPQLVPPLQATLALPGSKFRCEITGVKSGQQWNAVVRGQKSKEAMEGIFICFRTAQNTVEPVCDLRDLEFLVRDVKIRVCSRFGFFFAFVALLLGEGVSLRKAVKSLKETKRQCPTKDSTLSTKGAPSVEK